MTLTKHFSESEFFVAGKAGRISACDRAKAFFLSAIVLESIRAAIGNKPIGINSGKRSRSYNTKIGGATTSDHLFKAESCAADIDAGSDKLNRAAFDFVKKNLRSAVGQAICYIDKNDQMLFIHVSLPTKKHHGELMRASFESPRYYARIFEASGAEQERIKRP